MNAQKYFLDARQNLSSIYTYSLIRDEQEFDFGDFLIRFHNDVSTYDLGANDITFNFIYDHMIRNEV